MFSWDSPENIGAGLHNIQVRFNGGRDWVDPIGDGDSANPEFYYPSVASENFSVSVPTEIVLITQGGQVDREETLNVQGRLIDIVGNSLEGLTIEIWLDGSFLTNVTTDATGQFNAIASCPCRCCFGPSIIGDKI